MSNKNSQIILEDNRNDFSFKKNKSNINISFNRVSFIFFIFFIITIIFTSKTIYLGFKKTNQTQTVTELDMTRNRLDCHTHPLATNARINSVDSRTISVDGVEMR